MSKTILDLCRQLPGSEPELRERAEEFNRAARLTGFKNQPFSASLRAGFFVECTK